MVELLNQWLPNVMDRPGCFIKMHSGNLYHGGLVRSYIICGWFISGSSDYGNEAGKYSGTPAGLSDYRKVVNLFRSVPFIILLACLVPLSRLIMGTAIGVKGAIVPLVFGCAPFFTRQIESALADVDPGLIEAAQSMGLDNKDIIFRVYLKGEYCRHCPRYNDYDHQSDRSDSHGRSHRRRPVWATLPLCMVIRETCRISLIQQWLCWLSS